MTTSTGGLEFLAALDAQIAELTRQANRYVQVMDGRGAALLATQQAAWRQPAVRDALKPRRTGDGLAGPWIKFFCPNGHSLVPARLFHDGPPDDAASLVLTVGRRQGARRKAELDSPTPESTHRWLNTRDQWRCPLRSCSWPGRAYRPEHLLKMHVVAVVAGMDAIPLDPIVPPGLVRRLR